MSDAVSAHGFTVTRRGYEAGQVEQAVAEVTAARDRAWQRLADLGELSRRLEQELAEAVRAAAEAAPPSFAGLSERAVRLLDLAEEEAAALRAETVRTAERTEARSRADAAKLTADIRTYATRLTGEADQAARDELARARALAEAELADAAREAGAVQQAALEQAAKVKAAAAAVVHESEAWLATRKLAADQEQQQKEAQAAAVQEQAVTEVERLLGEAERHRRAMRDRAAELEADAATRAEQLLGAAHREAARIADVSDREQQLFAEQSGSLQAHLDHIRQTLTALVGAPSAVDRTDPRQPEPGAPGGPAADGPQAVDSAVPEEA